MLAVAIDTLKQRNNSNSFVDKFIKDRGLPVWDGYHSFDNQQNKRILRVPVRDAHERKITGFIDMTYNEQQPSYHWIARGTKLKEVSAQALETIFWGYEKEVFGITETEKGARIRTRGASADNKQRAPKYCTSTCAGSYCGDWECEGGGGGGSGDDGGFGGNADDDRYDPHGGGSSDQGGGSTDGTNPEPDSDPVCREPTRGHSMAPPRNEVPSNPNLPPCEEEGNDISFRGEIDASDLKNHPKADCVYQKLSQTNTMEGVVGKFAGENTNFDLDIELADLAPGDYGSLNSSLSSNTFTMQINRRELGRTPVEIAGTLLHEAIHAEMRRYLYGATDTSTLPGFPGDFSADWEAFVKEIYSGNPQKADHEVMATKYISVMADGLEEFGGGNLTRPEYEGIAWIGLRGTDYYTKLLNDSERSTIDNDIKSAKNTADEICN